MYPCFIIYDTHLPVGTTESVSVIVDGVAIWCTSNSIKILLYACTVCTSVHTT